MALTRQCAACPTWTQTVCKHAFAERWKEKSRNGEGCDNPLDEVAEAWRDAGWTPARRPLPMRPAERQGGKITSLLDKYRKGIKK